MLTRLQRLLPWSNTPRAWTERLSFVVMLAAAAALVVYVGDLPPWASILISACLLVVAAVLFRRGWLKAFGPILWYDLVRTSRRARTYFVRSVYLLILFAVLAMMYWSEWVGRYGPPPSNSEIARFASHFFYAFLITQFVLMVFLTPAYTAGAIADEKQKKTIQFLLVTDLRSHEIILGKLGSRMAHLGLLLLAGLPVLGVVQFLGGVDPHLVLAGFAGTAVTLASAAGVSLLASVIARPPRSALMLAYVFIILYVVLCVLGNALSFYLARKSFFAGPALASLIDIIETGNPIEAARRVFASGDPIEVSLPRALGAYALFHGAVALASILTASIWLRRASLREPRPRREKSAARRPPIGDRAMVWKEIYAERGAAGQWYTLVPVILLIGGSILYLLWVFWFYSFYKNGLGYDSNFFWTQWREGWNAWVRTVGTILACLSLFGVAIRAANSIRTERDRETFDSLLTSPLSSEDILYGKWLGAILSVRWMAGLLVFVWGLGVVTGGLHILAVPLLFLAWCVYAAAMASVGLWFSLVSRTTARSVLYTILTVVGLSVGHWLLWLPCGFLFLHGEGAYWIAMMEGGLTPPAVLGLHLPFGYDTPFDQNFPGQMLGCAFAGLVVWAIFAWIVWLATNERFKDAGGRVDVGAIRYSNPPPHRLS